MGDIITVTRKDGDISYKARIRRRGEKLLTMTFRRKTDAANWIKHTEAQLLEGKGLPRPKRETVAQAIDRYLSDVLPEKKQSTRYVQGPMLEWWKHFLGEKRMVEVDYNVLKKAREYLQKTPVTRKGVKSPQMRGPASINRYFALLRHVFSVAVRDWEWIDDNPVSRMRGLREPKGRARILTEPELQKILDALEGHPRKDFRLIVLIALVTGCRRGNAQAIQWEHIDIERQTIIFPDTKNGSPHVVPIPKDLIKEIQVYRIGSQTHKDWLFPAELGSKVPYVDIKQVWRKFTEELGIEDLHFHDLRHAVGTFLAKQNVPLLTIGKLLAHKSLESTKRYVHIGVADVAPHVEQLGERLRRIK